MGDMKYEFKIGDKLWEKHNHRVVTLKENHRTDSVTKWWHIEEDSMEWREDSFTSIPPYVYLLLKKQQKVEELLELYREKSRFQVAWDEIKSIIVFKKKETVAESYKQLSDIQLEIGLINIIIKELEEELK